MSNKPTIPPPKRKVGAQPGHEYRNTNPKGTPANLIFYEKGRRPPGAVKPKGAVDRKKILKKVLFNYEIEELSFLKGPVPLYGHAQGKTVYEMMALGMAIKAMAGDVAAFNALNQALGVDINIDDKVEVIHIFKPQKLSHEEFNQEGKAERSRVQEVIEAEVVDGMETPTGTTDTSPPSS